MTALYLAFLNSWRGLVFGGRTERAIRLELALLALGVPAALILGGCVSSLVSLVCWILEVILSV